MFESLTKNIFTIYSFEKKKSYFERAARKIASEASTHAREARKLRAKRANRRRPRTSRRRRRQCEFNLKRNQE